MQSLQTSQKPEAREKRILDFSTYFKICCISKNTRVPQNPGSSSHHYPIESNFLRNSKDICVRLRASEGGSVQLNICSIHVTLRKILATSGRNKFDSGAWDPAFALSPSPRAQTPESRRHVNVFLTGNPCKAFGEISDSRNERHIPSRPESHPARESRKTRNVQILCCKNYLQLSSGCLRWSHWLLWCFSVINFPL